MSVADASSLLAERPVEGRERIAIEARRLFGERGFNAVSMQQIADAAGVNKATLYHHFRDKEELFLAVVSREIAQVTTTMQQAAEAETGFRNQLSAMITALFETTHLDYFRFLADVHEYVTPERRHQLFEGGPFPWNAVRPIAEAAIARGEIRAVSVDLVSALMLNVTFGQMKLARMGMLSYPADASLARFLADFLMDGLATPAR